MFHLWVWLHKMVFYPPPLYHTPSSILLYTWIRGILIYMGGGGKHGERAELAQEKLPIVYCRPLGAPFIYPQYSNSPHPPHPLMEVLQYERRINNKREKKFGHGRLYPMRYTMCFLTCVFMLILGWVRLNMGKGVPSRVWKRATQGLEIGENICGKIDHIPKSTLTFYITWKFCKYNVYDSFSNCYLILKLFIAIHY